MFKPTGKKHLMRRRSKDQIREKRRMVSLHSSEVKRVLQWYLPVG